MARKVLNPVVYHLIHQGLLVTALVVVSLLLANNPSADDVYKPLTGYLLAQLSSGSVSIFTRKGEQ